MSNLVVLECQVPRRNIDFELASFLTAGRAVTAIRKRRKWYFRSWYINHRSFEKVEKSCLNRVNQQAQGGKHRTEKYLIHLDARDYSRPRTTQAVSVQNLYISCFDAPSSNLITRHPLPPSHSAVLTAVHRPSTHHPASASATPLAASGPAQSHRRSQCIDPAAPQTLDSDSGGTEPTGSGSDSDTDADLVH